MNARQLYIICILSVALPAIAATRSNSTPNWGGVPQSNKTQFHGECCYNDPVAHGTRRDSGYPATPVASPRVTPSLSGIHIECPKLAAVRVIEGIDSRQQPYSFRGTPWTPGQAQVLSAYRTQVTRLNNQTHLLCYYGNPQHQGNFPLDRIAATGETCASDGHAGFYCRKP